MYVYKKEHTQTHTHSQSIKIKTILPEPLYLTSVAGASGALCNEYIFGLPLCQFS